MCGLFAGVGKLNSNRIVALGSMNEERGTDSVGLAYIERGEMKLAKIAERPCVGLNLALRKEVTQAAISGLFIGHTRQATQGAVTSANAHPFFDEGIAFAHNGIIFNDDTFGKYPVDSQSLIHGIKAKDFSRYEGPIALVWIQDGKLNAYRCGNPLYRGRHGTATYLASDNDYLKAIGCTHVRELTEGMIYTFVTPISIVTKRVPKNKPFVSYGVRDYSLASWEREDLAKGQGKGLASSYADYCFKSQEDYDAKTRYKLDAPKMEEVKQEDFNTWADDRKARQAENGEPCAMCCGVATDGEYCDLCAEYVDKEMADIPPMRAFLDTKR